MRIGALAHATGVTTKTLRYYEAEGLLPEPDRTSSGYRDYRPEAVNRVAFIRSARSAGLTLRQIKQVLTIRDGGVAPCAHIASLVSERLADVDRRIRELRDTRGQLLDLRRRLRGLDPDDCAPDVICSAVQQL